MVRGERRGIALGAACLLILSVAVVACGGGSSGGGSSAVPGTTTTPTPVASPTATPTPPGASSSTIVTDAGSMAGTDDGSFSTTEGDTSSGGQGQAVDGVTCDPTMSNNYHVHVWLGLWVNGEQVALPMGVGMENPGAPGSGSPSYPGFVNAATCFYHVHVHDQSGIVHVEDPNPNNVPITGTLYTLQQLFDEWGITVNSNQFGPFSGSVRVFTSGQTYQGGCSTVASCTIPGSELTFWGTTAGTVPLYSHEVIDVEVGPTFPSTPLPNVDFYTEY